MKLSRFVFPWRTRRAIGIVSALCAAFCTPFFTGCGGSGPGYTVPAAEIGRIVSPDHSVTLVFYGAAGSNPNTISYQRAGGKQQPLFGTEKGPFSVEARGTFAFWTPAQNKAYYMGTIYNQETRHYDTKLYLVDFDATYPQFEGKLAEIYPYTDQNLEAYDSGVNLDTKFYPIGFAENGKKLRYAKEVASVGGFTTTTYEFDTERRTTIELK